MEGEILVEVSARHVHLNREAVEILFGKGYELTFKKALSQKGQFVCEEKVAVVGGKSSFKKVSVLGPERKNVQVEISKTDARTIGVEAPIKESGDLNGAASCKLVGPNGELELKNGVIVAKRHIHASSEDALKLGVKNGDIVSVEVLTRERALIFKDVVVRVSNEFNLAMHIDTDEANAANVITTAKAKIINLNWRRRIYFEKWIFFL